MTAVDQWQEQIRAFRQERREPDSQAWERASRWYDLWVGQNDYVQKSLNRLRPLIAKHWRVLEIGPGSGGFTVPLSGMVSEILAVEPSQGMRSALSDHLAATGRHNVDVLSAHIEESLDTIAGPFDLALASFSLYNVLPIDRVIRGLVRRASLVVALMGNGDRETWYRDLYQHFWGRQPVSPPQVQFLSPVLEEMGLVARVEILQTSANYVYPNESSLLDQWMARLHLGASQREELRAMLLPLTERRNGHIGIYRQRRAALVSIRQTEQDDLTGVERRDATGQR